MDLDINITSSCRISVLLIPIKPIRRLVFTHYVDLIQQFNTIRLSDVTPDNNHAMFTSQNFQKGQIHFQFSTCTTDHYKELIDFQPHRRLYGVIGIMDCQEWKDQSLRNGYQQFQASLEKYPSSIVQRCFAFDPADSQPDDIKGLIMIPNVGDKAFYMNTMICDFASEILIQFSILAKSIRQHWIIKSPTSNTNHANSPPTLLHNDSNFPSLYESSITSHNLSTTTSTSSSIQYTSKISKRAPGRIKKLYADFYLLSGRLPDALSFYKQAIDMTRITSDYLWLASAMEGYVCATVLLEQLQQENEIIPVSVNSPSSATNSPRDTSPLTGSSLTTTYILEQYNTILYYYSKEIKSATTTTMTATYDNRRNTNDNINDNDQSSIYRDIPLSTHPLSVIYAEACLKVARLLLTVYWNGPLDKHTSTLLLQGKLTSSLSSPSSPSSSSSSSLPATPISISQPSISHHYQSFSKAKRSGVDRWDIGQWTTRIWEASINSLAVTDQILVMSQMAMIYSSIGYYRKAAWLKFSILQLLFPVLLNRRNRSSSSKSSKIDQQFSKLANINDQDILILLKWICNIYLIVENNTMLEDQQSNLFVRFIENRKGAFGQIGWPTLQMDILRHCIILVESLHAYDDMLYYTSIFLKKMYLYLPKQEQIRLAHSIQRINSLKERTAILFGKEIEDQTINYWDINIVKDIRPIQAIPRKTLHRHPLTKDTIINAIEGVSYQNDTTKSSSENDAGNANDPFIYNPFKQKKPEPKQIFLIQNEVAEFQVLLVNPFGFDLELQSIRLSTTGVSFHAHPQSAVIASRGTSTLLLSGVPSETGLLKICGCFIKIIGFAEQEFMIDSHEMNNNKGIRDLLPFDHSSSKTIEKDTLCQQIFQIQSYRFPVIEEQPLLKLQATSLTQGAVMLFEGERTNMTIKLHNIGTVPVDYIYLSFTDDSTSSLFGPSSDMELSMEKQYEMELLSLDKVFTWNGNIFHEGQDVGQSLRLPPDSTLEITIAIYGKKGCSNGNIQVDYGYLDWNHNDQQQKNIQTTSVSSSNSSSDNMYSISSNIFYTRQLCIPLLITVYSPLKTENWDLLYIRSNNSGNDKDMKSTTSMNDASNTSSYQEQSIRSHHSTSQSAAAETMLKLLKRHSSYDHLQKTTHTISQAERRISGQSDYCLATIDIQNRWSFPFLVRFSISNDDNGADNHTNVDYFVSSNTTARVLLPIKRFVLSDKATLRPITLQPKKQFIVPQTPRSALSSSSFSSMDQEQKQQIQLRLFWYRENLLQRIQATWTAIDDNALETGSENVDDYRHGILDLRSCLKLTLDQLSILKKPDVIFDVMLEGDSVKQLGYRHFSCRFNEQISFVFTVSNQHLDKPTKLILRIQSIQNINDETKEYNLFQPNILLQGMNQVVLPALSKTQQAQHTLPVFFLAKGQYEFLYHAQDVVSRRTFYDHERMVIDVVD
ncbi:TRAPP II complex [Halteromyces radiatus]|uniref:TRAPP II complex n=1 Tax=Halteromyces radiatus TaxID=101107 RepID=UPI0022204BF8|nr:TRAPP II complex [Halteromyces radiatus]KAI8097034.1 TRAPP II complex [Halteromyces radiatus]